ncbi:hypothetical protein ACFL27_03235 [candidate division CSSED10-310 bacterium]|uniref:SGNH hydrolase-type esterase domain-containing protein n=1 Tax=candidate division CSSED10-310 bacterium TaxID=2855610 RepID=A0ABV6YSM8_UNCC1
MTIMKHKFKLRSGAIFVGIFCLICLELLIRLIFSLTAVPLSPKKYYFSLPDEPIFVDKSRAEGKFQITNPHWIGLFNYQEFPVEKATKTVRIFCLGGSSTYGYPFGASLAWPRWLKKYLQTVYPDKQWEVINAGADCYGSFRVLQLFAEILDYEPDLIIIFSGNNEFLEPHVFRKMNPWSKMVAGLQQQLEKLILYRCLVVLNHEIRSLVVQSHSHSFSRTVTPDPSDSSDMYTVRLSHSLSGPEILRTVINRAQLKSSIAQQDRELTYALYRQNIEAMASLANHSKVHCLLLTVPTNIAEWVPNVSWAPVEKNYERAQDRADKYFRAWESCKADRNEEALAEMKSIWTDEPEDPMACFIIGLILRKMGQYEHARIYFQAARDKDRLPLRAPGALNEILKEVATKHGTGFLDLEEIFSNQSPHGICGFNLFWDNCHPTRKGQQLIAQSIMKWLRQHNVFTHKKTSTAAATDNLEEVTLAEPPALDSPWTADMIAQMGYLLECLNRFYLAEKHYRYALVMDDQNQVARSGLPRVTLIQNSGYAVQFDPYHQLREAIDLEICPD